VRRAIPFFALPNILAGEEIIPEIVRLWDGADDIVEAAIPLFTQPDTLRRMQAGYGRVKAKLGEHGPAPATAAHILGAVRMPAS
jgi:lipid A disaccharide synthetase